jgi:hypothetical protein
VTKNAILLVDLTNHYHKRRGVGQGGIWPILMTTFAMIFGMWPSAASTGGAGSARRFRCTIGGLNTSTAALLVVPSLSHPVALTAASRRGAPGTSPRLGQATRIAGLVVLLALAGWVWSTSTAYGQTPAPAPLTLTFDQALERALTSNEALQVAAEGVKASESRVAEASAAFLPSASLSYQYQPLQRFPEIVIPPGVFGPEEQRFEAAFVRKNVMQLEMSQALYAGGRLTTGRESSAPPRRARPRVNAPGRSCTCASCRRSSRRLANRACVSPRKASHSHAPARTREGAIRGRSVARLDVLRASGSGQRGRRIQYQAAWTSRTSRSARCSRCRSAAPAAPGHARRCAGTGFAGRAGHLSPDPSRPARLRNAAPDRLLCGDTRQRRLEADGLAHRQCRVSER